jgi:hypothetical protein
MKFGWYSLLADSGHRVFLDEIKRSEVGFDVVTAAVTKIAVCWVII